MLFKETVQMAISALWANKMRSLLTMLGIIIANKFNISLVLVTLLVSSFISSITVGGKAIGKRYAIKNADKIIFVVAKVLNRFKFKK